MRFIHELGAIGARAFILLIVVVSRAILVSAILGIPFLFAAFVELSFDPGEWAVWSRLAVGAAWFVVVGLLLWVVVEDAMRTSAVRKGMQG